MASRNTLVLLLVFLSNMCVTRAALPAGDCTSDQTVLTACGQIDHAECRASQCQCQAGFKEGTLAAGNCVKVLGGTCNDPADCTAVAHAVCKTKVCACGDDYTKKDNECTQTVASGGGAPAAPNPAPESNTLIGEHCDAVTECATTNAVCEANKCACPTTHKNVGTTCVQKVLGDQCADTAECVAVTNAVCNIKVCACGDGDVCTPNGGDGVTPAPGSNNKKITTPKSEGTRPFTSLLLTVSLLFINAGIVVTML